MNRPLLLGLDLGTSRCKALLVDPGGQEAGVAGAVTPFVRSGDRVEMTVGALVGTVAGVLADLGSARSRVVAVGITGLAESGAPLGAGHEPLAPVIAWHDPRGAETVAHLEQRWGDELPRRVGQRLRTVSSVAKLGWLIDHGVTGTRRWLGVPELCLSALTGTQSTDYSLATRTGAYDIVRRRWMDDVLAALGVPSEIFPPVRAAGTVMGRVRADVSGWAGLASGVPVTLAGHDHLAALAGSGAGTDDFGNSVGTAESVVAPSPTMPDLDRSLALGLAVTPSPGGEGWAVLAGAARAGTALAATAAALGSSPADLDRLADGVAAPARPDLLAAALAGDLAGAAAEPPGAVWSALLATLSTRTWEALARAATLVGPPARLVVFGGGAASRPWLSAKAGLGTIPLWRTTAREAAARGAALAAGVAAGWWPTLADAPPASLEEIEPRRPER